MTAPPNEFDRPWDRSSGHPDRIIYTRHNLVGLAGDSYDRYGPAVLLEGSWPRQTSSGHAQALDEAIDARLDWIDQEALRLAQIVAEVRPPTAFDVISPARLNELSLRYYLVKLIRVVAYFVEVSPLGARQQIRLVAQPGRDDDYVDLIANLCRAASAQCRVQWVGESRSANPTFAANGPWRRGLGRISRLFDPGMTDPSMTDSSMTDSSMTDSSMTGSRMTGSRSVPGPRIVLCGNPRLLEPVGRELAGRTDCLWWLYDRFAAKSWLRWRPRGVGQLVCDSSLGAENRLRQPDTPPLVSRGIDLKSPVGRWLAARLETHGARQTRIIEQIDSHFRRLRPQRLVLDEDATPLARAAVAVARRYGARSFVVQHGAPLCRFGFAPLWADKILAWGESSRRQFARWGLSAESIEVVGSACHPGRYEPSIPLPARSYTNPKRKRGRQVLSSLALRVSVRCVQLDRERPKPGSAGKQPRRVLLLLTVPPRDDRPDAVELHLTRQTYAEMLRVALSSVAKIPDARLVVKLHPRASQDPIARQILSKFTSIPSRVVTRGRLETWLARTDCVLSCVSGGGVDATVAGIPVIQLLPAGCGNVLPHEEWGFVGSAHTEDELDRMLNEAFDANRPRSGLFVRNVFEHFGDTAAAAVANAVLAPEEPVVNNWEPQPNRSGRVGAL